MRIGYDAKRAFLNRTGLGNYSRWLIRSLASYYPENAYYLYTPKIKPGNKINFPADLQNISTVLPINKLFTSLWRSSGIVKDLQQDHIELYHGLSHELPAGIANAGIRSVVTIHDLIFMRFPQYFGWVNRIIYGAKVKYACHVADKIIAISERTRQDIIELIGISPDKIDVIYQGCDSSFKSAIPNEQKQAVLQKYNLPAAFILYVGTIEERKNLLQLVKALSGLNSSIKLVAIGRKTRYAQKVEQAINKLRLEDRVIFLNSIAFADLPAIYQSAKVFVYPSRYEGFGIPVLEALCSGTPVIAATGSCLEEAGGPDSLYVGPDDVQDLTGKLNLVLGDESLRRKMIVKGKEYSANFDDERLAHQIMTVYKNILHHA
jgi:glycosyltransferase involved in cell wall biosynthesis